MRGWLHLLLQSCVLVRIRYDASSARQDLQEDFDSHCTSVWPLLWALESNNYWEVDTSGLVE